jgi:glycosyltransferase involved in cell wall biosynthesis
VSSWFIGDRSSFEHSLFFRHSVILHFPSVANLLENARLLYATSARIGGSGLDSVAIETLRGAHRAGVLRRAIAFADRQREREIPGSLIRSLRAHPVRLLSFLDSPHYYGVKKHYLDWIAARELARGDFNLFHGWSGECVRTLREARRRGIPSLIEIPTWHRNKGKRKPAKTKSEREREAAGFPQRLFNNLLIPRQQMLEEYDLATLILVLSEKAAETFRIVGIPDEKLFRHSRGVDVERFTPAEAPPAIFRAVFVGALIKRKGVHQLLEVWHRLNLKDAELVLVGSVHEEIEPFLQQFGGGNVKIAGFAANPQDYYRQASVHIFPSTCEGSAKATYEAAACGLPQITTRESGDVVVDGLNGIIIPPNDPDALAAAIERLYGNADLRAQMGAAGRKRVVENFTWEHFRQRLLAAYERAMNAPV